MAAGRVGLVRAEITAFSLALVALVLGGGLLLSVQHALICSRSSPELARELACGELAGSGTERLRYQLQTVLEMFSAVLMRGER
jgi:hypothetical protein